MAEEVYKIPINDKMTDISELKVTELKAELKKRGVSTTGTKRELYEKLKNYLIKTNSNNMNTVVTNMSMNSSLLNNSLNNNNNNNLSLNTTQSDFDESLNVSNKSINMIQHQQVENIQPINEQLPLKRLNEDNNNDDQLNHKKVKHVNIEPPPPAPEPVPVPVEVKKVSEEPPVVVTQVTQPPASVAPSVDVNNENNEMELSINKSRSNSVESRSPTRSVSASTRSPSPSSRSTSRSNSVLNNNNNNSATNEANGSTKSESVIKEIPMSGDRNRFSRSRSPKSRWHAKRTPEPEVLHTPTSTSATLTEEAKPAATTEVNNSVETSQEAEKKEQQQETSTDMPKVERKRRWFTNATGPLMNTSRSISISSDTLKTYLPEAKIPKSIDADVLSTNEQQAEVTTEASNETVTQPEESLSNTRKVIKGDQNEEKYVQRQPSRTVIIEKQILKENNELIYEDALTSNTDALNKSADTTVKVETKKEVTTADEPERVAGDVSPARQPVSTILHVKGLTRPFTLPQLKELLSKYGKTVDSKFWIDNVKSHCFATYETIEDAKLAREGLHRTKWPQSNPKVLRVDFTTEEELTFFQNGEKPVVSKEANNRNNKESKVTNSSSSDLKSEPLATNNKDSKDKLTTASAAGLNGGRDRERDRARDNRHADDKETNKPIREWDLPKLKRSRSRSRDISMERRRKNQEKRLSDTKKEAEKEEPVKEEEPAKVLEDIFRKTNATPHIYWLPLTDEEITERAQARQKRMEERERRRQEEREREEAEKKLEPKVVDDKENKTNQEANNEEAVVEKHVNGNGTSERNREDDKQSDRRYRDDKQSEYRRRSPERPRNDDRSNYRSTRR